MLLRMFQPEDLDAVMAMVAGTFQQVFSQEMYLALAQVWPQGQLVAVEGGRLAGVLLSMRRSATLGRVLVMAVDPQLRGRGIGAQLLHAFLRRCTMEGITSVVLEVRVSNTRAQAFYRRFGFREAGPLSRYYPDGEDGVLMTRELV